MNIQKHLTSVNISIALIALILAYFIYHAFIKKNYNASFNRYTPSNSGNRPNSTGTNGIDRNKTLSYGSRGVEVKLLQEWLNNRGATPPLVIDGIFGELTKAALVAETGRSSTTLDQI